MLTKPRIVDLFSGCGGFGLGAELAGFESVAAVDIDSTLQSAYGLNFPTARVINGDVSQLEAGFWKKTIGRQRLDGLIGGPPCQGFSRIGKKAADDPRNSLIGHFYRHVRMLKPKFFVMENVVGLLDEGSREHLFKALGQVPEDYVILGPLIVNAAEHGAPTKRKRVVVIGYDPAEVSPISEADITAASVANPTTIRDAISDLPSPIADPRDPLDFGWARYPRRPTRLSDYAARMRMMPENLGWDTSVTKLAHGSISGLLETKHTEIVKRRFADTPPGEIEAVSRYPRLRWDGFCPTLRAGTGNERGSYQAMRPIHPSEARVITVREGARLQGFPDWFVFHPSKWHSFRMIGNSVSPPVSYHILSKMMAKLATRIAA
ncbi:DNA cytosine methyltransferase [Luteolibacter sp. GHJ8]|uniref:Cytosine-specific methyltransferase n=1 Tax=Luteolibacter rhizosphaerae TaxID=2989719 RepID=A0ABT3G8P4_9BACT|nr:DNA cytosine methyltransferase [Luteolibacter rhizosphaerae]MCW1915969.1 DNA cytosine methyltransferase [Luteolibacter rhizosphaerae]